MFGESCLWNLLQTFYRHPPHLLCQLNNYPTALCPNATVSNVTILLSGPGKRLLPANDGVN